jgi:hypothetical protein
MIKTKKRFLFFAIVVCLVSTGANAQNIFPQVVGHCNLSSGFCLDCGDPQASIDTEQLVSINTKIAQSYSLSGIRGMVLLQVLVDSLGNGCVLSHTDKSNSPLVQDIVKYLNSAKWIPAVGGKPAISSINIKFQIINGKITSEIQRIDNVNMLENMKNPGKPNVYNKTYQYKNPLLSNYNITVWQKENSELPQDMSQHSVIDKNDNVWYATLNGFAEFNGKVFTGLNELNSPFKANLSLSAMAISSDDNIWIATFKGVYEHHDNLWIKLDSAQVGTRDANNITCNRDGEVLFSTQNGLVIYKAGNYKVLNKQAVPQLPSNDIYYAYRDKKQRLWIGTFKGSIMIDADNKVTEYNNTDTPLKDNFITDVVEDDLGNEYFAVESDQNSSQRDRDAEGLIIHSADDKWIHYNDKNSGLPANRINSLMYDKLEKVLWIGTSDAGLVRFDLKDGWEDYHNENSKVPSTYIYNISQDSKGNIYVSTYDGMMRINKQ